MSKPVRLSLDLLLSIRDTHANHAGGPFLIVGSTTPVTYKVVGWDADTSSLLVEKVTS